MTLQYQREINGENTLFPEKIIRSLDIPESKKWTLYDLLSEHIIMNVGIKDFQELHPKIHTIRQDDKGRWKVGSKIHNKIWTGKPYHSEQYQFTDILKAKAIQRVEINIVANVDTPYTYKNNRRTYQICVDGNCLELEKMIELAKNDGFESLDDFLDYFRNGFTGIIIHWTSFTY